MADDPGSQSAPNRSRKGKKSIREVQAVLQAEKMDALAAVRASKLSADRTKAVDYYMGDMQADMPAQDGRSRAVSTDVADTVEGLMPSLMEIFAGSDDVVRFDPVGPNDIAAAEQETDYVNHVFMQQNPGFLVLYSFIKDALLSKVGIVKVWWEEDEQQHKETYYDIPDDGYALLAANPEIEIIEHSERPAPVPPPGAGQAAQPGAPPAQMAGPPPMLHDVTVLTKRKTEKACVLGVPPEEFGISRFARSLRDCGYCFHEVLKREEDAIAEGFDERQVKSLPTWTMLTNPEELARDTVDEHLAAGGDQGINEANRQIKVTEHYIRMDYEQNGKPSLYRVTTGSDQGEVLNRDGKPDIEEVDHIPFAAMTPVIVTHRFFGRSIADLVMDIQRIKTALYRSILDNAYLAVHPRVEVAQSHSSEETLDDLLVSRPGGVVRTKQPGGLQWQTVPAIAGEIFPVLEYVDAIREWRTGVSRVGQGIDANSLQNQSATAAMQVYNAAQARMKLIARIFAETGIRDLFQLLHATIRKNGSQQQTVQLRNQWVTVDPREWKDRDQMTVNVGLGTGGKTERLSHVMSVISLQKDALVGGLTNLVTPENLYNSASEVVKLVDLKDPNRFFSDPKTQPPPQPPPDPKIIQMQMQAQLEQQKQQTDAAHQQAKLQADAQLAQQKADLEARLAILKHELEVTKANHEMQMAEREHQMTIAQGQMDMSSAAQKAENDAKAAEQKMAMAAQPQQPQASVSVSSNSKDITDAVQQLGQHVTSQSEALKQLLQHATAPREIVRGKDGKAIGVRTLVQ